MRQIEPNSIIDERPVRAWFRRRQLAWLTFALFVSCTLLNVQPRWAGATVLCWLLAGVGAVGAGSSTASAWIRDGHWPPSKENARRLFRREWLCFFAGWLLGMALTVALHLALSESLGRSG